MAVLGLCHCVGLSLATGYSLAAVCELLLAVASLVAEHGLEGTLATIAVAPRAELPHSMWELPSPGIKPVSPGLAGGFFTIEPPGKPHLLYLFKMLIPLIH